MLADLIEKIKNWFKDNEKDIILAIGVFLIAVISFGLGVLSQNEKAPIIIENSKYCATSSAASEKADF